MSEHAASGGFDLGQAPDLASVEDEGIVVHIRGMDGELLYFTEKEGAAEKPVTITVAGEYSHQYRRVSESITTRYLRRNRGAPLTGERLRAQTLETVAGCILAWDGWADKGKKFPCTKENALMLLKKLPFVQPQLTDAMSDHAGFFEKPSGS